MYKINRNAIEKYKGKRHGEGLSLELEVILRKRNCDNGLDRIRQANAKDIDGIVSLLVEYGVLEEVDSDEDDSEEEDEISKIIDRLALGQLPPETISKECLEYLKECNKKNDKDAAYESSRKEFLECLKKSPTIQSDENEESEKDIFKLISKKFDEIIFYGESLEDNKIIKVNKEFLGKLNNMISDLIKE